MASQLPPQSGHRRIDSWKEIAALFGRDERTVKRWEKERGLPVHRVPGGRRSAVFAYAHELEKWLEGKNHELDAEDSALAHTGNGFSEPSEIAAAHTTGVPVRFLRGWLFARIAAWVVPLALAAWLVVFLWAGYRGPRDKAVAGRHPSTVEGRDLALSPDSVAVLPFFNARGNAHAEYLSDGITESLISNLARVPRLKVRSRDSVFRFKGKDLEVQRIGSSLGVSVVVSGRVLLEANVIEISVELTNVSDNTEIWGQHYRGGSADLISLQQRMAGDIAEKLRSSLSAADRQRVASQGTQNAEAYSLYLKGRYAWNKRTLADLEIANSLFNEATRKDPEYALAYSGIADVYSVLFFYGGNPRESFPKSNAAARKALEIDPTLAHPHAVLGTNEMRYDWDFTGGEAEFRKAIERDPNDATAHQWYAESLSALGGRDQEALAEIKLAHGLDPLSPVITRVLAGVQATSGQYDEAISICRKLASEDPTFAIAHDCLYYAYWGKRMYQSAIEEAKAYGRLSQNPEMAKIAAALERGFQSGGWPGALTQVIALFESRHKNSYASPFEIARFYADLGNKDKAFEWLDRAYQEHDGLLIEMNTWFQFASLRADPRFAELVSKVGLPKLP